MFVRVLDAVAPLGCELHMPLATPWPVASLPLLRCP